MKLSHGNCDGIDQEGTMGSDVIGPHSISHGVWDSKVGVWD